MWQQMLTALQEDMYIVQTVLWREIVLMSKEHSESQLERRVIKRIIAASGCLALRSVNAPIDQVKGCRVGSEVDRPDASCIRVCSFGRAPHAWCAQALVQNLSRRQTSLPCTKRDLGRESH